MHQRIRGAAVAVGLAWMLGGATRAHTAELRPETLTAFDRYVRQVEQRMEDDLHAGGPFLLPDGWPPERRDQVYQQLRRGEMVIERVNQGVADAPVPHGLIHHWAGIVFIPGATLDQTLAIIQDYDHHQDV